MSFLNLPGTSMAAKHLPFHHRILFRLLIPVILVGIFCSTIMVTYLSSPLKDFLTRQFDASLRQASVMGLQVCQDSFNYLLDLRLENNLEMNQVLKKEALDRITGISEKFPHIHMMVVKSGNTIKACSMVNLHEKKPFPLTVDQIGKLVELKHQGNFIRAHVQFSPFWDWYIVSFTLKEDYDSPIRMAYKITHLSAAGVFLVMIVTLLFVFHLFIKKPLDRLISATDGITEGKFTKIDDISDHEIGQLMISFNEMVDSLESEKAEVQSLIHKLRESEGLFRSQFEFGNIGIAITRPDDTWVRANERLCDILGYTEEQLHKKSWSQLLAAQDAEKEMAPFHRMQKGQIDNYDRDTRMMKKTGEKIYVHLNVSCYRNKDQSIRFVIISILDITNRKQAEAEIRNLRNYLSNIIDSMPSALIGVDREGRITQWNRKVHQITGVPPESAMGQSFESVHPAFSGEFERVEHAIRNAEVCSDPRQARKEKDEILYEDITIYPLVANGVEGAVIRIDDVTEQVRLEEMMIQSEKMLSVGGLAAGMAHEINNPLAGMIQNANVMQSRLQNLDLPANLNAAKETGVSMESIKAFMEKRNILKMVDAISESGRRVAEIVDNMLSFARKTNSTFSTHDPVQLMDQILEIAAADYDLKKQYDFKTIQIIKKYEKNLPTIACEGAKIQQVLLNILRNGAHAMQAQQNTKGIRPCFILRLSREDDSNMLKIEIQDNGPGMEKGTQHRIFEPFFTTKPVGIGTGLGLSVSYFIVTQNHKGKMDVISAPGKGSTFIIRLPLEQPEHRPEA